jgi:hypothetical protein
MLTVKKNIIQLTIQYRTINLSEYYNINFFTYI